MSGLYLTGIGNLTTNDGEPVTDAAVIIDDGVVVYAGPAVGAPERSDLEFVDCGGRAVIPGFVDAHTHLVFAGDRAGEFSRRMAGETYQSIAAGGGGIMATVEATRATGEEELFELASGRVARMIAAGTTSLEIKSGYGLDVDTEIRLLRVARRVGEELGITVRTTFLGAHTTPHGRDRHRYVDLVTDEMLPAV
ncbi:MAG: imidazolonepropionase, partial [Actinobacteria bacterium]|nr:imidazolonepropionase [Actinomycetota bacterium]